MIDIGTCLARFVVSIISTTAGLQLGAYFERRRCARRIETEKLPASALGVGRGYYRDWCDTERADRDSSGRAGL